MTRVLLAYDGTDPGAAAIEHAARLLSAREALVACAWIPVQALDRRDPIAAYLEALTPPAHELDEIARDEAHSRASKGAQLAEAAGMIEVTTRVLRAAHGVWRALLETADHDDVDAIVVGTGSAARLEGRLLGSTARALVSHSDRPVLAIPPAATPAPDLTPSTARSTTCRPPLS
jgi:nucleotide-binding universal stress UspA family protein